jgi:transketolase
MVHVMQFHSYSATMNGARDTGKLRSIAANIRLRDLQMVYEAGAGHIGGDMSAADILTALFFNVLRYDAANPAWADRDRFVLSKGHSAGILYVTLAAAGFFDPAELSTFLKPDSRLNGHPNRTKVAGVETNTGPLGHGLPVSVGVAKAAKLTGRDYRTFVLVGDGELQEGSNWEAAMAANQHRLDNLTVIVDRNRLQQGARTEETNSLEPLADRWRAFGWSVAEVDGHDYDQLIDAFEALPMALGKPNCIIAHTQKGRGISFMTDRVEWHHKVPNSEQYAAAREELERAAE